MMMINDDYDNDDDEGDDDNDDDIMMMMMMVIEDDDYDDDDGKWQVAAGVCLSLAKIKSTSINCARKNITCKAFNLDSFSKS